MDRPYDFSPVDDNIQLRRSGVNNLQVDTIDYLANVVSQQFDKNLTNLMFQEASIKGTELLNKTKSPTLTADEATEKYGIKNRLKFDKPVLEEVAKIRNAIVQKDIDKSVILEVGKNNNLNPVAEFLTGLVAGAIDPINIVASFIPIVGEPQFAKLVAQHGKIGGRAIKGLAEGGIGNAILEPFNYALQNDLGYEYSAIDSLSSIAFGGLFGAGLHVGAGSLGDWYSTLSSKIDSDSNLNSVNKEALSSVLSELIVGDDVELSNLFEAFNLQSRINISSTIIDMKNNGSTFDEISNFLKTNEYLNIQDDTLIKEIVSNPNSLIEDDIELVVDEIFNKVDRQVNNKFENNINKEDPLINEALPDSKLNEDNYVKLNSSKLIEKQDSKENSISNSITSNNKSDFIDNKFKSEIEKELAGKTALLEEQLKEKEIKLDQANQQEIELRKEKIRLEDEKKSFEIEKLRQLEEQKIQIAEEATKRAKEEQHYIIAQLQKQVSDAVKAKDELARKLEQGSQQTQGEVLELELEEQLKVNFPIDEIIPVPKGVSGADLVQKVINKSGHLCGQIIWESKKTKAWSEAWIQKLKDDQRSIKADIAVIVSVSLPEDIKGFGFRDGIWICDTKISVALATALRINLESIAREKNMSIGKNEKMDILYNYLTGIEFKQRVEAIIEAFSAMDDALRKERNAYEKIWSEREKQIKKVMNNTIGMYGDLSGLVSLPQIKRLELEP